MHLNVGFVAWSLAVTWFFWLVVASIWESRRPFYEPKIKRYHFMQAPIYFLIGCLLLAARYVDAEEVYDQLQQINLPQEVVLFGYGTLVCLIMAISLIIISFRPNQPECARLIYRRVFIPVLGVFGCISLGFTIYYL